MARTTSRLVIAILLAAPPLPASIIGINPPAQSLTRARIEQLPSAERATWLAYLERSERQRQADKDFFAAELKYSGFASPINPPHGFSARSIPLDREHSWYAGPEAQHIADVIVSFQTPAGGWGKNLDMTKEVRRPGERFAPNNLSHFLAPGDFDTPRDPEWNYVGTIDNDATTTELQYLARVITAGGPVRSRKYRAAFLRGIHYLLNAQFPNGGWPQVWPLEGGYHDAITYNDDAMIETMEVLLDTANGRDDFAFVPAPIRARAAASFGEGMRCILATQIRSHGVLTVWPQQADPLTLQPESGRNFEPPAESANESADILLMMMSDLPHPDAAEQHSIQAAAAWFKRTAIYGETWEHMPNGRELVPTPGADPIWARYYQIGTDHPIFVDRDKTIHDTVADLSLERRNGYNWFSSNPQKALDRFEQWNAHHPDRKPKDRKRKSASSSSSPYTYDPDKDGNPHQKKQVSEDPKLASSAYEQDIVERGFKWSPVKVYRRKMVRGVRGETWRLDLSVTHWAGHASITPERAVLIITVSAPKRRRAPTTKWSCR